MFKCSPLPVSCLRNHFRQRKTEYVYKKASHSKTSFPVVPSNFSMHFLLEGPFIKIIFVIAFCDAFLCVPLAIQYGMNLKGKYVGWHYKTLFVQLSFWLQFFFLERIMVQSSCCAMQTHTMETSFEIKQITERHYSALLCMLNIDDYGRCNFVIFTMTLGRDKLEDMDVSLKMSASLRGPTLQIWITQKWVDDLRNSFCIWKSGILLGPLAVGFVR